MQLHHIKLAVAGALALVVAHDLVVTQKNKAINQSNQELNETLIKINEILIEENTKLCGAMGDAHVQMSYLIAKLNEHGVPADEFDMIVLNSLTQ